MHRHPESDRISHARLARDLAHIGLEEAVRNNHRFCDGYRVQYPSEMPGYRLKAFLAQDPRAGSVKDLTTEDFNQRVI